MQDAEQRKRDREERQFQIEEIARCGHMFQIGPPCPAQTSICVYMADLLGKEAPFKVMVATPSQMGRPYLAAKERIWAFWKRFVRQTEDSSLVINYENEIGDIQGRSGTVTIGSTTDLAILKMLI